VPELAEVEVVRRGLAKAATGAVIQQIGVMDARSLRLQAGGPERFRQLEGARLGSPARRGKFLWLPVDAGADTAAETAESTGLAETALAIHLGMSGRLLIADPAAAPLRHERVRLILRRSEEAGRPDGPEALVFADQRLFGWMQWCELVPDPAGGAPIAAPAAGIARDLLDPRLDQDAVVARYHRSRSPLKALLLNQNLVSGLGNIYADEALWRARLHPAAPGASVPTIRLSELLDAGRAVLRESITAGGTTFDTMFVGADGAPGWFRRELHAYGRAGEPCDRCGAELRRSRVAGRSSVWCPICQRR
jgi:formamidopyrimidine-DNA glycosylase